MSETLATDIKCTIRECRFNWKGVCTNDTFDSEEPVPCCWPEGD